jgi:Ca2+-binding EF-hand superfamily protein
MLIVLAMAAAAAGQGAPSGADLQNMFRAMDRDGNGYVTANEQPRVTRISVDGPNRATIRPSRSWISSYDANGDGRVSQREFVSGATAEIAAYNARSR